MFFVFSSPLLPDLLLPNPPEPTTCRNRQQVLVVAFRLAQGPQPYSLVATGLLRPKYHSWITAANGLVREYVLGLVKDSNDQGWRELDLFNRGQTQGLTLRDMGVIFPQTPTPSAQVQRCLILVLLWRCPVLICNPRVILALSLLGNQLDNVLDRDDLLHESHPGM